MRCLLNLFFYHVVCLISSTACCSFISCLNLVDLFMQNFVPANGGDVAAVDQDDVWEDVSDSHGHASTLDREWVHRQNQFQKVLITLEFIRNTVVNANYSSAVFC